MIATLFCLSITSLAAALDFSVGGGMKVADIRWNEGVEIRKGSYSIYDYSAEELILSLGGFFDASWLQAELFYDIFLNGSWKQDDDTVNPEHSEGKIEEKSTNLSLGLLFKTPTSVLYTSFYPLLGIQCRLNLSYTAADGRNLKPSMSDDDLSRLNDLWVIGGIGVGMPFPNRVSARLQAMVGYRIPGWDDMDKYQGYIDAGNNPQILRLKAELGLNIAYWL
jgi:hypothetical protein